MAQASAMAFAATEPITDEEVVRRVLGGETALFEVIMRRYNRRLYRAARAITRDDSQAEDILQAAYVRAYEHLAQFRGGAAFGGWLTRITVHEALGRLRGARRFESWEGEGDRMDGFASPTPNPEQAASNAEIGGLLESLIEELPGASRAVFMLREVEQMSTAEVSEALGISEENVKVRLHRARGLLRGRLAAHVMGETRNLFAFPAVRCDRVVRRVFEAIAERRDG
jgi:RNA polymerase sigma-70 factor (ECF subfamily)